MILLLITQFSLRSVSATVTFLMLGPSVSAKTQEGSQVNERNLNTALNSFIVFLTFVKEVFSCLVSVYVIPCFSFECFD